MTPRHPRLAHSGDFLLTFARGRVSCPSCAAAAATSVVLVHRVGCETARKIAAWKTFCAVLDADASQPMTRSA
jgi:hypothetical protein